MGHLGQSHIFGCWRIQRKKGGVWPLYVVRPLLRIDTIFFWHCAIAVSEWVSSTARSRRRRAKQSKDLTVLTVAGPITFLFQCRLFSFLLFRRRRRRRTDKAEETEALLYIHTYFTRRVLRGIVRRGSRLISYLYNWALKWWWFILHCWWCVTCFVVIFPLNESSVIWKCIATKRRCWFVLLGVDVMQIVDVNKLNICHHPSSC